MEPEYTPVVGDGATVNVGSDSFPATIIEVRPNGRVVIQMDNDKLVSGTEQTGNAVYEYTADPDGTKYVVYKNDKGRLAIWGQKGRGVSLGYRRRYNDPSF
jgi:hypothetical protein